MSKGHVLVAVDFGPSSDAAVEKGIELARVLRATIDLVHVAPPPPAMMDEQAYLGPLWDRVNGAAQELCRQGVNAIGHLRIDQPSFGLLEAIDSLQPAWVVIGSHGREGFKRLLLGSVSEAVARRSGVPVVIVPAPGRQELVCRTAWSCATCGHIYDEAEASACCRGCGAAPARWLSAPVGPGFADAKLPSVGEAPGSDLEAVSSFTVSPPGTGGGNVNAELRVRY